MKKISLLFLSFFAIQTFALEGYYVGGQLGFVALTGNARNFFDNGLGFGADFGVKANSMFDVLIQVQRSSHGNKTAGGQSLTVTSAVADAEIHFARWNDFELSIGGGPGMYFFGGVGNTETNFGLHGGGAVDLILEEMIKIGVGWKYHGVFSSTRGSSYWTTMMRVGFTFGS